MINGLKNFLRRLTKKSRERQQAENLKLTEKDLNDDEIRERRFKSKAEMIIRNIAVLTQLAAEQGEKSTVIMKIRWQDRNRNFEDNPSPENLRGAAKIVWDWCVRAEKLNPEIQRWEKSNDGDFGYQIIVKW